VEEHRSTRQLREKAGNDIKVNGVRATERYVDFAGKGEITRIIKGHLSCPLDNGKTSSPGSRRYW
jgi:hypothetical protein